MSSSSLYIPHTTASEIRPHPHHYEDNYHDNQNNSTEKRTTSITAVADRQLERCHRLEQENHELKRQLNDTKLTVEELQDKNRFEATKVLELQDILHHHHTLKNQDNDNHNHNNNNNNNRNHKTDPETMELLVQKSLRLAELSLLVDDLRMENKQLHMVTSKLKKTKNKLELLANDHHNIIRSDASWDTVTTTATTTSSSNQNDEDQDRDDAMSIASSTTPSFDRHITNHDDIEANSGNNNWHAEREHLMLKLESLEQSLASLKQHSRDRTINTSMNLRAMQGQIRQLEADKRTLTKQNRLLWLNDKAKKNGNGTTGTTAILSPSASSDDDSEEDRWEDDHQQPRSIRQEVELGRDRQLGKKSTPSHRPQSPTPSKSSTSPSYLSSSLSPNSRLGRVMGGMRNTMPPLLFGRKVADATTPIY
jgi:hypothetical protein